MAEAAVAAGEHVHRTVQYADSMLAVAASRLRSAAPMPAIAVGMHASFSDLCFCSR